MKNRNLKIRGRNLKIRCQICGYTSKSARWVSEPIEGFVKHNRIEDAYDLNNLIKRVEEDDEDRVFNGEARCIHCNSVL